MLKTNDEHFAEETSRFAGARVALLSSEFELQEGYAPRCRTYLNEGAIQPNPTARFIDNYDLQRTSLKLAIVDDAGKIVGMIRFAVQPPASHGVMDSRLPPEFQVFPDVVENLLKFDRPITSAARFLIEPDHPRCSEIAILLMIAQTAATRAACAKWLIATARGSHVLIYRRFLMAPLCEERQMPILTYCYTLLNSDVDSNFGAAMERFPDSLQSYFEQEHPFWHSQVAQALPELSVRSAL